jgi:hypothetical protein
MASPIPHPLDFVEAHLFRAGDRAARWRGSPAAAVRAGSWNDHAHATAIPDRPHRSDPPFFQSGDGFDRQHVAQKERRRHDCEDLHFMSGREQRENFHCSTPIGSRCNRIALCNWRRSPRTRVVVLSSRSAPDHPGNTAGSCAPKMTNSPPITARNMAALNKAGEDQDDEEGDDHGSGRAKA